jgi:hypothetical protein
MFCNAELTEAIQDLDIVKYNVAPGSEGHDKVALTQESFGLRCERQAPPALELTVLVAVLQKLYYSRKKAMCRVQNQPVMQRFRQSLSEH